MSNKKVLPPNTEVIKVTHPNGKITFHAVFTSVEGYIKQCIKDGKQAVLAGVTDTDGNLKTV